MHNRSRDGVVLSYEEAGSGAPPLLFVHGTSCDHTHFAPQVAHFRRAHHVVALDLRGHGQSDKPEQEYTIAGFANDLAWLCRELGLDKPVLVGHSMGGVIALDLAARYPDLAAAVIMLDAPLFIPTPMVEAIEAGFVAALWTPAYRDAVRGFAESLMLPTDDPERRARLLDQLAETPQHVVASAFEAVNRYDGTSAATDVKVPALYIRAGVPIDLDRFQALCPHLVTGQTVGAGHFHQLEVPQQVNAMIERFLAIGIPR